LTWGEKGADKVSLFITGNEKTMITVLASITAGRVKLSLYLLTHEKPKRMEISQLANVASHSNNHSYQRAAGQQVPRPSVP
jgi:hypothetical protein